MDLLWKINESDVQAVQHIVNNAIGARVALRHCKNIEKIGILLDKNTIIHSLVMCLVTSAQKTGDESPVGKFLQINPFPVTFALFVDADPREVFVKVMNDHGLNRFNERIPKFFEKNFKMLEDSKWRLLHTLSNKLDMSSANEERKLADEIQRMFKGIGPKQARNFLQFLGLTRYEIPIDARLIGWINELFPATHGTFQLSAKLLQDVKFYHFVLNHIQELCRRAEVFPCMLDAAVYFDKERS